MEMRVTRVQKVSITGATERYTSEQLKDFAMVAAYEGDVGNLYGTLYMAMPGEDGEAYSWRGDVSDVEWNENFYGSLQYEVEDIDDNVEEI